MLKALSLEIDVGQIMFYRSAIEDNIGNRVLLSFQYSAKV